MDHKLESVLDLRPRVVTLSFDLPKTLQQLNSIPWYDITRDLALITQLVVRREEQVAFHGPRRTTNSSHAEAPCYASPPRHDTMLA